jgi:hypothetical protein
VTACETRFPNGASVSRTRSFESTNRSISSTRSSASRRFRSFTAPTSMLQLTSENGRRAF